MRKSISQIWLKSKSITFLPLGKESNYLKRKFLDFDSNNIVKNLQANYD